MLDNRVTRAVILAAGTGSRLREVGDELPKPLRPVAGVPLCVRVIRTLAAAGVREVGVVIGYQGERLRHELLAQQRSLGVALTFIENSRFDKKNGVSLLAAKDFVDR